MLTTSKKTAYQWGRKFLILPLFILTAALLIVRCQPADEKAGTAAQPTDPVSTPVSPSVTADSNTSTTQDSIALPENQTTVSNKSQPVFRNKKGEIVPGPEIFSKVEKDASFPGNWVSFLQRNINGQVAVDNGAPPGKFTTITQFIVDREGNVSDIKALTAIGYGMEKEAIRVIKRSGKWQPAIVNGKPVKAFRKQPITFAITEE